MSPNAPTVPAPLWKLALIASGPLAVTVGLIVHRMWQHLPGERFAQALLLAGVSALFAWPLRRMARLRGAEALALIWIAALAWFAGPLKLAAALLIGAAALALGLTVAPRAGAARLALATLLGLLLLGGATGWLLQLPIHYAWLWAVVCLALIVLQRHALRASMGEAGRTLRASIDAAPRSAALAVSLIGLASTACWLPTLQFDDLAYHLGLPAQLLAQAQYRPDPGHQVWALAPWLGDTVQGLAAVLGGGDARGAVNALWLLLTMALAWALAGEFRVEPRLRWWAVALCASFPPFVWMGAGMQTELPATAVLMGLALVLVRGGLGWVPLAAILFAGLAALKPIHAVAALPLVAWALWQHRADLRGRQLPLVLLIGLVFGASSYVQSWWLTGNPVLPLFNHLFGSPYAPVEPFVDPRWHAGFGPGLLWEASFNTSRYVEAYPGGMGFTPLALAGAALLALIGPGRRGLALALIVTALLPLLPMQYLRYAWPGLVVLSVFLFCVSARLLPEPALRAGVIGLCLLNLAFQASAGWTHHSAALKRLIRDGGDTRLVFTHYIPERGLLRELPAHDARPVLATQPGRPFIAELGVRGRSLMHHAPWLSAAREAAEGDESGAAWQALFERSGAGWLLLVPEQTSPALRAGLARAGAEPFAALGDAELWVLPPPAQTSASPP